jgi:predicted nucleic acid-binding protein
LPIPIKYKRKKEIAFYERYFAGVNVWVDDASIIQPAYDLACQQALGAVDALHLAAAIAVSAEFISAERPSKPLYAAYRRTASIF